MARKKKQSFTQTLELYYDLLSGKYTLKQISKRNNLSQPTISRWEKLFKKGKFNLTAILKVYRKVNQKQLKPIKRTRLIPSLIETRILELIAEKLPSFDIKFIINSEFEHSISRSDVLTYLIREK